MQWRVRGPLPCWPTLGGSSSKTPWEEIPDRFTSSNLLSMCLSHRPTGSRLCVDCVVCVCVPPSAHRKSLRRGL